MSTSEYPIRIDVPPGSTALVVSDDGLVVYCSAAGSSDIAPTWNEVHPEDRDELESLSLNDPKIEPPIYGTFQVSIEIDAPVEQVFEYVSDVRTHPEYADFVDSVEIVSENGGEDTIFIQTHESSTEWIATEFELYEPTDCVGWVTRKETGDIHIRYWFEPVDGGTRVTHAGIAPLHHDSPETFASDLDELRERYENNVEEMSNLRSILE